MKKCIFLYLFLMWTCFIFIGCSTSKNHNSSNDNFAPDSNSEEKKKSNKIDKDVKNDLGIRKEEKEDKTENVDTVDENNYISSVGDTLATRIKPPQNYERVEANEDSFTAYMRNFRLNRDGSPILLYNGKESRNQSDHVAVFDIELEEKDLQQCADSIIRLYSEYYWSIGKYENIKFHLTNNFLVSYVKWREGYRLSVRGNDTSWVKSAEYDDSYNNFLSYLTMVFMYAGTLSLNSECSDINLEEITPGDIFIKGGSPGHCVMIIDIARNTEGEKAFLLAQGYMPAQEFHVLKNPLHEKNPWYYASEFTYPFITPQWTFEEGSLKRWFQ